MDEAEFVDFFTFMHPKIVRYACRWLDIDAASEVANDTMRTLYAKQPAHLKSDEEHRQLQSLCYRISEGLIKNELRAERRRSALFIALASQAESAPGTLPDFVDSLVNESEASRVLGELSETDRRVLHLILDGYRVAEMAVILECTPAAATMRLRRARDNLRGKLETDRKLKKGAHDAVS